MKKELVDVAEKIGNNNILEADFTTLAKDSFHKISEDVITEIGLPLTERVFPIWQKWLNEEIKRKRF
jgi:hypothetical protein